MGFEKYKKEFHSQFLLNLEKHLKLPYDPKGADNQPYKVIEKSKNTAATFSRILDEYKVPVPPYEEFKEYIKAPSCIGAYMQSLMDDLLPELLNEDKTALNPRIINAINHNNKDNYRLILQRANNDSQQLARFFIQAIVVGYSQQMLDEMKKNSNQEAQIAWFNNEGAEFTIVSNLVTIDGMSEFAQKPLPIGEEEQKSRMQKLMEVYGDNAPRILKNKNDAFNDSFEVSDIQALKTYLDALNWALKEENLKGLSKEKVQELYQLVEENISLVPLDENLEARVNFNNACKVLEEISSNHPKAANLFSAVKNLKDNVDLDKDALKRITTYINDTKAFIEDPTNKEAREKQHHNIRDAIGKNPSWGPMIGGALLLDKVVYHSLDFDGCYSNEASSFNLGRNWITERTLEESNQAYLEANREFLDSLKTKGKTVIFIGSNRQTPYIDLKNGTGTDYPPGSVYPRMDAIAKELGENATFNPFLLPDLESDVVVAGETFEKFNQKGYLKENGSYKEDITSHKIEEDGFLELIDDESKVSLALAQMHYAAMENPDDIIEFNFYDDRKDIVESMEHFFKEHPELIPKNVILNLRGYSGPQLTQEQANENLLNFLTHTTTDLESVETKQAISEAQKHNIPILIKMPGEEEQFKLYRRASNGDWEFTDFNRSIKGLEASKFDEVFPELKGIKGHNTSKNMEIFDELKKHHYLPIPATRRDKIYNYGSPTLIAAIAGEGSIPEEVADWKPLYAAVREASMSPEAKQWKAMKVASEFDFPKLISQSYSDTRLPAKRVKEFIDHNLSKMGNKESAEVLSKSKISSQAVVQILNGNENKDSIIKQIIENKVNQLKEELSNEERQQIESFLKGFTKTINTIINEKLLELNNENDLGKRTAIESYLIDLYKLKIRDGNKSLAEMKINNGLKQPRNALCSTITDALKSPITLQDCQKLNSLVIHARNAATPNVDPKSKSRSLCELSDLSDELVGAKSEKLQAVSAACGVFAVVATIVAFALAPTGIGFIIGMAVAGALAAASIGTGIAAKVKESDLSQKTRDFKQALEEKRDVQVVDAPELPDLTTISDRSFSRN
ncbi:hypothetical protein [Legionella longbeachae]|uniref:hypothetical protein n=1 Tax=Legionella longbeachae TaxID=450 RepID=UPI0012465591|nr:hypothetical protein [Legionella longbeachae]QEY52162.1 hypothetical protein FQU71_13535 [Legionella longbeachae]